MIPKMMFEAGLVVASVVAAAGLAVPALGASSIETRLAEVTQAADQLEKLAEQKDREGVALKANSADVTPLLEQLCQPKEAQRIAETPDDILDVLPKYIRQQVRVMDVLSGDGKNQRQFTENLREAGNCVDAILASNTLALEKLNAGLPSVDIENGKKIIDEMVPASVAVFDGVLEGCILQGVGDDWCIKRTEPLLALAKALAPQLSLEQRKFLGEKTKRAAKSCPAASDLLLPVFEQFYGKKVEAKPGIKPVGVPKQGIDLQFTPPKGLCQVDPSRSKADQYLWTTLPDKKTAELTHTLFVDCLPLEQARRGDFSGKMPTNVIFLAVIPRTKDQTPPIPYNLKDYVSALVVRDTPRYKDAKAFFGQPKETASALLGSDKNGVYYGTRKFDKTGKEEGGGIAIYTMIDTSPIVIWVFTYEAAIDEAKFNAAKQIAAQLQAKNSPPVTVDMKGLPHLAKKVESCLTLPVAARGRAVVTFTIKEDGTLEGKPVVIEQGKGEASEAIGKAAIRALQKCQPYSEYGLQGQFHLPFVIQ